MALIYNWWSLFVRLADPDLHARLPTGSASRSRRCAASSQREPGQEMIERAAAWLRHEKRLRSPIRTVERSERVTASRPTDFRSTSANGSASSQRDPIDTP